MRLPSDAVIAPSKLHDYLLVWRRRSDKSAWLAGAGYTRKNWAVLLDDLREQILSQPAQPVELTDYGQMYEIKGTLVGPNGVALRVHTVWMTEASSGRTKFITLYPDKEASQ